MLGVGSVVTLLGETPDPIWRWIAHIGFAVFWPAVVVVEFFELRNDRASRWTA